jgi:hypothetical protein
VTLTASLAGWGQHTGDLFFGAANAGPVKALAVSQLSTAALALAAVGTSDKATKKRVNVAVALSSVATVALAVHESKNAQKFGLSAMQLNLVGILAGVQGFLATKELFSKPAAPVVVAPVPVVRKGVKKPYLGKK